MASAKALRCVENLAWLRARLQGPGGHRKDPGPHSEYSEGCRRVLHKGMMLP